MELFAKAPAAWLSSWVYVDDISDCLERESRALILEEHKVWTCSLLFPNQRLSSWLPFKSVFNSVTLGDIFLLSACSSIISALCCQPIPRALVLLSAYSLNWPLYFSLIPDVRIRRKEGTAFRIVCLGPSWFQVPWPSSVAQAPYTPRRRWTRWN